MSYQEKLVWTIIPKESFKVIRSCPKCGCKSKYSNTGNFRVNANGNYLDVWLIYQCDKCKNTLNLEIYERVNSQKVPVIQYKKFLSNDKELAFMYGRNKGFFQRNKAEIEQEDLEFEVIEENFWIEGDDNHVKNVVIRNSHSVKIRLDKVIAKKLEISRMKAKRLIEIGTIFNNQNKDLKKIIIYDDLEFTIKDSYN